MHQSFTNILWYLEFFAFVAVLISFFCVFMYLANVGNRSYSLRYDMRKNAKDNRLVRKVKVREPTQRPVCCDLGCIWFCRLIGSVSTIAICYYCAYTLISDSKLKFGIFMP